MSQGRIGVGQEWTFNALTWWFLGISDLGHLFGLKYRGPWNKIKKAYKHFEYDLPSYLQSCKTEHWFCNQNKSQFPSVCTFKKIKIMRPWWKLTLANKNPVHQINRPGQKLTQTSTLRPTRSTQGDERCEIRSWLQPHSGPNRAQ